MRQSLKFLISLTALVIAPVYVLGQTDTANSTAVPLTLRNAMQRALDANPSLRGQRFGVNAASARVDQAAQRPPIEIGIEAENILSPNRLSQADQPDITLRLGTVIELGSKRARRMDAATSERELVLTQNDSERLDVLAEVARRFIRVVTAQEEYNLAVRRLELAQQTGQTVEQRVNSARSPKLEGSNAAIAITKAQIEQEQAASAIRQTWSQLASLWGSSGADVGRVFAELFVMPALADYTALSALIDRNPDILRFASERRVQEAKLRLAQAQRTPDVTVSAGYRRFIDDHSSALVLSASIPLGTSSRASPFISEAQSLRQGVEYKEQAARAELLSTLQVALEQTEQSRREVQALLSTAIPKASEAQSLAEQGYQVGRFSLLELITAQQQLTDLQRQAIDAAASFHESLLEVERLTGRSAADRDNSTVGTP